MPQLPLSLQKISLFLQRLPGIGEKTANRLAFYLLRLPDGDLQDFGTAISQLKTLTKRCRICQNLCEGDDICSVCSDTKRNSSTILIVESVLDILSFEMGGIYDGLYHVLHGKIDPLNRIGPDDLTIDLLIARMRQSPPSEVIIATNPDMEGEATALYIKDRVRELSPSIAVSRLGYGVPVGGNVEYTDYVTLKKALEGKTSLTS